VSSGRGTDCAASRLSPLWLGMSCPARRRPPWSKWGAVDVMRPLPTNTALSSSQSHFLALHALPSVPRCAVLKRVFGPPCSNSDSDALLLLSKRWQLRQTNVMLCFLPARRDGPTRCPDGRKPAERTSPCNGVGEWASTGDAGRSAAPAHLRQLYEAIGQGGLQGVAMLAFRHLLFILGEAYMYHL
jgi:hypothetical protein